MRNRDDFDQFYLATAQRLTRNLYLATGDLTRAEECVQEAYLRAWQRWTRLDHEAHDPLAWVRTAAWRLAANDWRRVTRSLRALVRHGPPGDTPAPSADVLAVRDALARLPQAQRTVLVLHYYDDLPVREIAAVLNVPEGTVKARLSRGRGAMAAHLHDEDSPPPPRIRGASRLTATPPTLSQETP